MARVRLLRDLGFRVRTLREKRGMSQERLAERAGLHPNYVGMIERGDTNPSFLVLVRVSRALKMTVAELVRPLA